MRTIKEALDHAASQEQYAQPDAPNLVSDFVLLANELKRLRTYGCQHPFYLTYRAFIAPAGEKVFGPLGMKFETTPVEVDKTVQSNQIHFPQGDGTCIVYNY